jgi:hypothetical protein
MPAPSYEPTPGQSLPLTPLPWRGEHRSGHQGNLLNLPRIGPYETEIRREPRNQFDVFSDKPAKQSFGLAHDRVVVHHSRLNHLPTAERQELAPSHGR